MCLSPFYHLLYSLEDNSVLSSHSDVNIFSPYYIYLPRISAQLEILRQGFIQHKLQTQHKISPLLLWIIGMLQENDDEAAYGIMVTMSEVHK